MSLRRLDLGTVDHKSRSSGRFALMMMAASGGTENAYVAIRSVPAEGLVRAVGTAVSDDGRDGITTATGFFDKDSVVIAISVAVAAQLIQQWRPANTHITRLGRDVAGIAFRMRVLLDVVVFGVVTAVVRCRSGIHRNSRSGVRHSRAADVALRRRRDRVVLVVDIPSVAVVRRQPVTGTIHQHVG